MAKKILMMLVLAVIIAGGVFAQEDFEETDSVQADYGEADTVQTDSAKTDFAAMAKNTIVVDVGPTIIGGLIGVAGDMIGEGEGLSSSGFGIAAQYERQISKKFGVAARFAYLGGSVGISDEDTDSGATLSTNLGIDMSSFSIRRPRPLLPLWGNVLFGRYAGIRQYVGGLFR
jgi:opacity protein-like surface antigen